MHIYNYAYSTPIFFFFFLVLCLPRQVRTSNGAIHHDPQLSPSTCCNPLSASSPVTSFLVPLFFFPSILPSIIVLRRESPLIMWPSQFLCWLLIIHIIDLFSSTILSISSLVLCSIQLILSILRHIHISKASNLLISSFLIVHVSDPYNTTLHIIDLIIRFFRFCLSFPLSNSFLL